MNSSKIYSLFVTLFFITTPVTYGFELPALPSSTQKGMQSLFSHGKDYFSTFGNLRQQVLLKKDKHALAEIYKMAQQGYMDAIIFIGYLYDNGEGGVAKNSRLAAQFWYVAAKKGEALACYNLGILYWQGRGVAKNEETARQLFAVASDHFMSLSDFILGLIAEERGDVTNALNYYKDANSQKHPTIAAHRAILLLKTQGASTTDQVFPVLLQAAEQWDALAQYHLARFYASGIGNADNTNNPVEAAYWLQILKNNPYGKPYWKQISTTRQTFNISDQDIEQAQSSAAEWVKTHQTIPVPFDYTKTLYLVEGSQ